MRLLAPPAMLALALVACGCGGGSAPPAPVFPVTGAVTYKGKPVVGADVTFFNSEANRSAFGRTNEQGEYELTTFSANDGAVAGKSIVTITKVEAPVAPVEQAPVDSPDYQPPGLNQSTTPARPKSSFPAKYGSQETSGLVAVVSADAPNKINFDLKE